MIIYNAQHNTYIFKNATHDLILEYHLHVGVEDGLEYGLKDILRD